MAYEKRVCVLKQIKKGFTADGGALSGAVYAERLGDELTVTPKIANVAPLKAGRYILAVWADGQTLCGELAGSMRFPNAPSLSGGFSALLCFVKGDAEPVAYGYSAGAPQDYRLLVQALEPSEQKKQKPKLAEEKNPEKKKEKYDDDAIAATDYYSLPQGDENEIARICAEAQDGEVEGDCDSCQNDGAVPPRPASRGTLAYYDEVKGKLREAFEKFPQDKTLLQIFPRSEWVNTGGALLGILYAEGLPRYLCVAAPAEHASEEMKREGVFVPASHFSDDEGYIVVFQSADTGDYVKPQDG